MSTDLALMSATDLIAGFRDHSISPREATAAALDQISAHNDRFNAYCLIDVDGAMAAAGAAEARWQAGTPMGPLDGVPTSIKDLSLTKGWPTLRGSKIIDPAQAWTDDAPYVAHLRSAGAVFLGKTTTPEYGWKGVTDSLLTGITRNPWDDRKTPGGSSGGAAVAAATGMGALHQGSDGGGSIRMPAGYTGIYGLKATYGQVPSWPASPFGTLSHAGPMTRTVRDAALMLKVMAQHDPRDWYGLPGPHHDWTAATETSIAGWRIAYSPDLGHATVDPEIAALVAKAVHVLRDLGANVEEVEAPIPPCRDVFEAHWFAGAINLARDWSDATRAQLDPGLNDIISAGEQITLADYQAAVSQREVIGMAMNSFFADYDALLTPTLPIAAFDAGQEVPTGSGLPRWYDWSPFSYPFNLSQHPAASMPCGLTSDGLPAGLQIVSAKYREDKILAISAAYEQVQPIQLPALD